MYIPKHYMIQSEDIIYEIIDQHGFGTLFSQHNGEPCATHLPLNLNKEERVVIKGIKFKLKKSDCFVESLFFVFKTSLKPHI